MYVSIKHIKCRQNCLRPEERWHDARSDGRSKRDNKVRANSTVCQTPSTAIMLLAAGPQRWRHGFVQTTHTRGWGLSEQRAQTSTCHPERRAEKKERISDVIKIPARSRTFLHRVRWKKVLSIAKQDLFWGFVFFCLLSRAIRESPLQKRQQNSIIDPCEPSALAFGWTRALPHPKVRQAQDDTFGWSGFYAFLLRCRGDSRIARFKHKPPRVILSGARRRKSG